MVVRNRTVCVLSWMALVCVGLTLASASVGRISVACALIACLFQWKNIWKSFAWPFVAFCAWVLIASGFQENEEFRFSGIGVLYSWLPVLFFAAFPVAQQNSQKKTLLWLLQITLLYATVLFVLQITFGYERSDSPFRIAWGEFTIASIWSSPDRPTGPWNQGVLVGIMSSLVMLAIWSLRSSISYPRVCMGVTGVLWILISMINKTRTAIFGFILCLPLLFLKKWSFKRLCIAAVAGLILTVALVFTLASVYAPLGDRIQRTGGDGRFEIWKTCAVMIQEKPLLGQGGREAYNVRYKELSVGASVDYTANAHNSVIALAVEFGIPAAILWIIGHILLMRECWCREKKMAFVMLAAYHMMGMLDYLSGRTDITVFIMALVGLDLAWKNQHDDGQCEEVVSDEPVALKDQPAE